MDYRMTIHEVDPQPIVSIRERHPMSEIPAFMGRTFGVLFTRLGQQGIPPAGPPFVIYHEFGPETVDAEVCVPVGTVIAATADMVSRELPAATVVRTLHVGPYEELGAAYEALNDWIALHGTEASGPPRERYLNGPGEGAAPADYRTELEMPVIAERIALPA
jgi:effector-binding domain-containing protein